MEPLDDRHYLEPPDDDERWCAEHDKKIPCEACKAEERD